MKLNLIVFAILFLAEFLLAQESTIQLPTSDNTSSFSITKQNGSTVFKVDGNGQMSGDGSGLSNLRPVVAYAYGNQSVAFHEGMTGLNSYEAQVVREATVSCTGPGIIFATATGHARWESIYEDLLRIWFYPHPTVNPTTSWETPDYHNLRIIGDYGCTDSSDQYTSWSITKTYFVYSAQNFTVKLCADKPYTSSKALIGDSHLQLVFFPTGGTGPSPTAPLAENETPIFYDINTLDGTSRLRNENEKTGNNKVKELEDEINVLKEKIDLLLKNKDKK